MRAAVTTADGRFAVREVADPEPEGHEAVLRVSYCGICGSDLHAIRAGTIKESSILGHEIVGEIVALGPEARGFEVGDRVTTLSALPCDRCDACREGRYFNCQQGMKIYGYSDIPGGYAELVKSHTSVMKKVPEGTDDLVAAWNEPSIVGLHAVRISKLRPGDSALIIGAGPIGLLVLQSALLAAPGPIYVVEPSAGRRQIALEMGATAALHPSDDDVAGFLAAHTEVGPDVVFECAGARGTLQSAVNWVRPGGQIVVPGVNMEPDEISPLSMVGKECEIVGSLGGGHLFGPALELLAAGRINVRPMISKVISLDEVDETFQTLGTAGSDEIKILVAPNGHTGGL